MFASTHFYHHRGELSEKAEELIPPDTDGTTIATGTNFYLPKDFTRYGASFGFGQGYRENYTHAWRPFAEVAIFNNTRFGYGGAVNGGIAGSVFRRDHLALYYTRSIGLDAADQSDYIFGLTYRIYF